MHYPHMPALTWSGSFELFVEATGKVVIDGLLLQGWSTYKVTICWQGHVCSQIGITHTLYLLHAFNKHNNKLANLETAVCGVSSEMVRISHHHLRKKEREDIFTFLGMQCEWEHKHILGFSQIWLQMCFKAELQEWTLWHSYNYH